MGVASGCGCKEVYRFPHITYPYSSCICSFFQQHPYFLFIKKMFFVLYIRTVLDIERVENAFFHSMYIFSVILHAIDNHDIST